MVELLSFRDNLAVIVIAMADDSSRLSYDVTGEDGAEKVKIICLGDSAVGKSKWVVIVIVVVYSLFPLWQAALEYLHAYDFQQKN